MKTLRIPMALVLALFAMACVTINVYFPAEAAEKAADRIIKDVYGDEVDAAKQPQSWNHFEAAPIQQANPVLDWFIPVAHAAADLSVNTPAIRQLKADMEKRHRQLAPYYTSYTEIARANSHPEWEAEIRTTFARRWVDNAHRGWWYMDKSGGWRQK